MYKINKMIKNRIILAIVIFTLLIFSFSSCAVRVHDSGRRVGWFRMHENHEPRGRSVIIVKKNNEGHHSPSNKVKVKVKAKHQR